MIIAMAVLATCRNGILVVARMFPGRERGTRNDERTCPA
jgi:hypothetical protein